MEQYISPEATTFNTNKIFRPFASHILPHFLATKELSGMFRYSELDSNGLILGMSSCHGIHKFFSRFAGRGWGAPNLRPPALAPVRSLFSN